MKKRLLALLTVVLLLSITAVSSFALVPNRVPPLKEYFPNDVVLYPSNASQNYNNPNYQLWYETTCPYCNRASFYTKLVDFGQMYDLPVKDVDGLYTISHYGVADYDTGYYSNSSILVQINYDNIEHGYITSQNDYVCCYESSGKNPTTWADVYFIDEVPYIFYHQYNIITLPIYDEFMSTVNSPVAMVVPKYNYDSNIGEYVENQTYINVYGSFKNYVHNNSSGLTATALSKLAYNTICYSVYDKSIYDLYLSQYNNGYTAGETEGYNNGYTAGETEGYNNGYTAGETEGYQNGYNEGRITGQSEARFFDNGFDNLFDSLFKGFQHFIIPFLSLGWGTLTVGTVLGFILVVTLVMIIVKIVRG